MFSEHPSLSINYDTTSTASRVVTTEHQSPVSSQASEDDGSDNSTSRESVISFLTSSFDQFSQDFLHFITNNAFYCNEELLEKDWALCFTAVVTEDVSDAFWQKFKEALESHTLTKVIVLMQVQIDIDIDYLYKARCVLTNYSYGGYPFRLLVFDFTANSQMTT